MTTLRVEGAAAAYALVLGVETPTELDQLVLQRLGRHADRAEVDVEHRAALPCLGLEEAAVLEQTVVEGRAGERSQDSDLDFVRASGQFDVQITVLTPFPGTPLYDRLLAEGRILEPEAWERCTLFDVNFRPKQMSADELQRNLVELGRRLYTEDERVRRRSAFHEQRRRFLREARAGRMSA